MAPIRKLHEDYTVGWVTALPLERSAAEAVLDKTHCSLRQNFRDNNTYTLGEIQGHNVVITCLPSGQYGNNRAALVASQMTSSFPNIRYGLMVGIAGGAPRLPEHDIRLGDIVIGQPTSTHAAVVQYDFGKTITGGVFERTGTLSPPPPVLLAALSKLQSQHKLGKSQVPHFLEILGRGGPLFRHPGPGQDHLFRALYSHHTESNTCADCDPAQMVERRDRSSTDPMVHYGVIGTGNQVVKDAEKRDVVAGRDGILCFEMEAAGIVDHIPSLVIRGICDYSDSHKNKQWQHYAAAAAAAYAKDFLSILSPDSYIGERFKVAMSLRGVPAICNFIGRRDDLENLSGLLLPEVANSRKVVVLHGMSGIGKTQLAIRFMQEHKDRFTAIFWVNAQTQESIVHSLASVYLPKSVDIHTTYEPTNDEEMEKRAVDVIKWLTLEGNTKWLLVFDGLDRYCEQGYSPNIHRFFPTADHGSILVTTQASHIKEMGHTYRLLKLGVEEALSVLADTTESSLGLRSSPDIRELLARLDGHPLALALARSFMNETGATPSECLNQYSSLWHKPESALLLPHEPHPSRNIRTAWMLPFEETKKNRPNTFKMLLLLSHFEQQDIWPELIKGGLQDSNSPSWYHSIVSSNAEFYQAIRELLSLGLIDTKMSENSYSMHPVVQSWCQHYMVDHDRDDILPIAWTSIGLCVPNDDDSEAWRWQKRIFPHANRIFQLGYPKQGTRFSVQLLNATKALGNLFLHYGKLKEAEAMYQRACEEYKKSDPQSLDLLTSLDGLGLVRQDQSQYVKAEEIHLKVLAEKERRFGVEDLSTLDTLHHLAGSYTSQGRLKLAEQTYLRVLEGRKDQLGQSHPSTLSTTDKLGTTYFHLGDMKSAMAYYQRAYQGFRKHQLTSAMMNTVNNIGLVYLEQGKFEEAEVRHLQVVEETQKILGDEHPSILNAIENLGLLYTKQRKFEAAQEYLLKAQAGRKQILGSEHHSIIITKDNIAFLYISQGKMDAAEKEYQEALRCAEITVGLNHTTTLRILNNLGNLYYSQGMFQDAEKSFTRAMEGYHTVLGPTHTATLSVTTNLGSIYKFQDKQDQAEVMYQKALVGYRDAVGEGHSSTLDVMNNLGLLHLDQGRLQAAEELLERSKNKRDKLFGSDHPSTLEAMDNLGYLRYNQGRYKEAEDLMRSSLAGWDKIESIQDSLETKNNLGMICATLGKHDEAESMITQALAGLEELLDPDHPVILEAIHHLGFLLSEKGAVNEAKLKYLDVLAGRERTLGSRHTSTIETVLSLANLLRDDGQLIEARSRYNDVITLLGEILGLDHPEALKALCHFGALLLQDDDLSEAGVIIAQCLSGLQSKFGPCNVFTARAMVQMGRLRARQGRLKEAEDLLSKASSVLEHALGKDHRETKSAADLLRPVKSCLSERRRRHFLLAALLPPLIAICVYVVARQ